LLLSALQISGIVVSVITFSVAAIAHVLVLPAAKLPLLHAVGPIGPLAPELAAPIDQNKCWLHSNRRFPFELEFPFTSDSNSRSFLFLHQKGLSSNPASGLAESDKATCIWL